MTILHVSWRHGGVPGLVDDYTREQRGDSGARNARYYDTILFCIDISRLGSAGLTPGGLLLQTISDLGVLLPTASIVLVVYGIISGGGAGYPRLSSTAAAIGLNFFAMTGVYFCVSGLLLAEE